MAFPFQVNDALQSAMHTVQKLEWQGFQGIFFGWHWITLLNCGVSRPDAGISIPMNTNQN
jgi:hypothetical protein